MVDTAQAAVSSHAIGQTTPCVAAFKVVLPLTRRLSATPGSPGTPPTLKEDDYIQMFQVSNRLEDAVIASRYQRQMRDSARLGHNSYTGIAYLVEFFSPSQGTFEPATR
jgi:hypothetical protein